MLTPPCVTRWSGGAVSHHRRIAAAAGAAKQLIMLLNLEVNITAGSLTSCPGRCFLWTPVVASSCALSIAGGDVLSTRSTGIVFPFFLWWWWWCGDGCTARRSSAASLPRARSGSFTVQLWTSTSAEATGRSAPSLRALACFLPYFLCRKPSSSLLVSYRSLANLSSLSRSASAKP